MPYVRPSLSRTVCISRALKLPPRMSVRVRPVQQKRRERAENKKESYRTTKSDTCTQVEGIVVWVVAIKADGEADEYVRALLVLHAHHARLPARVRGGLRHRCGNEDEGHTGPYTYIRRSRGRSTGTSKGINVRAHTHDRFMHSTRNRAEHRKGLCRPSHTLKGEK